MSVALLVLAVGAMAADDESTVSAQPNLVKQANAPISSILQLRMQDTYTPKFEGVPGQGNVLTFGVTMPLPKYRLLPLPQLSLLTIPTAITSPLGSTGFGDVRFLDIAVLDAGHKILWGVGPTFVFPSASPSQAGQGKWQLGPAAAIAFSPENWLVGALVQNPISFAGDPKRPGANAMFLQPFVIYQLGGGWFLRSQPQMVFDWKSDAWLVPLDLGGGRVFQIGRRSVNCFVEPFWNAVRNAPAPTYGITFGVALLYPGFWD
jgi:hypothetical protein